MVNKNYVDALKKEVESLERRLAGIKGTLCSESAVYKKNFCFTGILDGYTRREAQNLVVREGGRIHENPQWDTDYIVVGIRPGSKSESRYGKKINQATWEAMTLGL